MADKVSLKFNFDIHDIQIAHSKVLTTAIQKQLWYLLRSREPRMHEMLDIQLRQIKCGLTSFLKLLVILQYCTELSG